MVEIFIVVFAAILISHLIAEKFNLIAPLVLIAVGVLVSFIPHLEPINVDPHIVLSVFLPVLLYWEALNISLRGIKRALRGVLINGTLMVIFIAVSLGLVGQAMGMTLGTALLVGAALGPTDATAVTALGKGISRRAMVVLRAESLINDGTALVVFALALEYASGEGAITGGKIALDFAISFFGGAAIGLLVGWVVARLGCFVHDPMLANIFRLMVPFLSYFLSEEIHASGVLSVVVTGLYIGQVGPKFINLGSRVIARPFWGVLTSVLNSFLFLLVGIHLPNIVRNLSSDTLLHALLLTLAVFLAMVFARFIFGEITIRAIRLLDRRPQQKERRTTLPERTVLAIAGFRGAISLAVALSIPEFLGDQPFPYRDQIIFVTSGVVILSLLIQGLLLPVAVRWAQQRPNELTLRGEAEDEREYRDAMLASATEVLENFDTLVTEQQTPAPVAQAVREEFAAYNEGWAKLTSDNTPAEEQELMEAEAQLRLAIIRRGRSNMIRFRDEGKIDEETLIKITQRFDLEELRIIGPVEID